MAETDGEAAFVFYARLLLPKIDFQAMTREWRPMFSTYAFRHDFAWITYSPIVVVEMEGKDHKKPVTYAKDITKYNLLAANGCLLFRVTMEELQHTPCRFFDLLRPTLIKGRPTNGNRYPMCEMQPEETEDR